MEQIDVFDESFRPLSRKTASIDEVHQQGLWHQTFACWLINQEHKSVYLQLRGSKNRVGPDTFDASSGGHLRAGEKPIDGFRELYEELGYSVSLSDKTYLGIYRNMITLGNYINHEFCHIYLATTIDKLTDFNLQTGEVAGLFELPLQTGIDLFSGKINQALVSGVVLKNGQYAEEKRLIGVSDFCACRERTVISAYYLKIMIMANRYLNKQEPYCI